MTEERTPRAWEWWYYGTIQTGASASPLYGAPDQPPPRREFNPGFEGANPGPSHPEPKPRYRVKAHSRRVGA
jgi:hypothetical protein